MAGYFVTHFESNKRGTWNSTNGENFGGLTFEIGTTFPKGLAFLMPRSFLSGMRFTRQLKFAICALVVSGAIFLFGVVAGRYDWLPVNQFAAFIKAVQKEFAVRKAGEEKYVNDVLVQQYAKRPAADPMARAVDSSRLPLQLTEVTLTNNKDFASGGGAIVNVEGTLVVMDWLGNTFAFEGSTLRKIDLGEIPNNLKSFIRKSRLSLRSSTLRAHYIAYDSARSTVYVSFEKYDPRADAARLNISSITIDKKTLNKVGVWKTIFESETVSSETYNSTGAGGRLLVSGNFLYFTVGDFSNAEVPQKASDLVSQSSNSSLGKIYEYDITEQKARVKSIGHRNPQGLAVTSDGMLISTEQGPEGGDEINLIRDGENYGWPYRTYGTQYGTYSWPLKLKEPAAKFAAPIYAWVPSVAISPLIRISNFDNSWDGDLLAGSLKAQSLYRIRLLEGRVVFSEPIWIGQRIRDIVQWNDKIALMTDANSLVFVSINVKRLNANKKSQTLVEVNAKLNACMTCHHFDRTNPTHVAPTLAKIMMRPIASDEFVHYSSSLKSRGGYWTESSLAQFISNPVEFAPGSRMPRLNLSNEEVREIVSLLRN